jgi:hypothetical protein
LEVRITKKKENGGKLSNASAPGGDKASEENTDGCVRVCIYIHKERIFLGVEKES